MSEVSRTIATEATVARLESVINELLRDLRGVGHNSGAFGQLGSGVAHFQRWENRQNYLDGEGKLRGYVAYLTKELAKIDRLRAAIEYLEDLPDVTTSTTKSAVGRGGKK